MAERFPASTGPRRPRRRRGPRSLPKRSPKVRRRWSNGSGRRSTRGGPGRWHGGAPSCRTSSRCSRSTRTSSSRCSPTDLGKAALEGWAHRRHPHHLATSTSRLKHMGRLDAAGERSRVPVVRSSRPRARIVHEPLGVALIIAPWNYPVQLAARAARRRGRRRQLRGAEALRDRRRTRRGARPARPRVPRSRGHRDRRGRRRPRRPRCSTSASTTSSTPGTVASAAS